MKKRVELNILIPLIIMVLIFVGFTIASGGKMITAYNMKAIIDQSMLVVIGGLGVIFVVAQGGADLSVGTTVALTTVLGCAAADALGQVWVLVPVALVTALLMGALNGFLVGYLKIPSFMCTIAMLIGVRGIVNYIQSFTGVYYASKALRSIKEYYVLLPVLAALVLLAYYLLEFSKFGRYSKAIGENESTAISVGVPVKKMKLLAFMFSALMAGIAGIFTIAKLGGTTTTMGSFFEMDVAMAIYLGGVLVTGGASARISKLLMGAFTLSIIKNGLTLVGLTSTEISQTVRRHHAHADLDRYADVRGSGHRPGARTGAEKTPGRSKAPAGASRLRRAEKQGAGGSSGSLFFVFYCSASVQNRVRIWAASARVAVPAGSSTPSPCPGAGRCPPPTAWPPSPTQRYSPRR